MHLRLRRRNQDAEKDRHLKPHFIVSVARGENALSPNSADQSGDVQRSKRTSAMQTLSTLRAHATLLRLCTQVRGLCGCSPVRDLSPQSNNLNIVAAEKTTLQTTVVAVTGKRRRQLLQCERYGNAVDEMAFPRACLLLSLLRLSQLLNRRHLARAGTMLCEGAARSKLTLLPLQCPPIPSLALSPNTRAPTRPTRAVHYRWS
jgi:hypothetical protein